MNCKKSLIIKSDMTHPSPKVSIVMAAKDTAPYLADCLDSILAQSYSNWELIAINDHSSDDTGKLLSSYAERDDRIKYHNSDRPKLIPSLKFGYQFVTGELINRMDSDDMMPSDKLATMVKHWQQHGKCHVIAGGTKHFVDEGEVGGGFIRYEEWLNEVARENKHDEEIYTECVIPSHCWLMHKEDFDSIDGFEPEVYPEDYDLCFRIYRSPLKVVGIDKVLHHWRDRTNRISRTWEEYKDNRYFDLKLDYFLQIDRDPSRPLVLWGAGRNGKDLAKRLKQRDVPFEWACENQNKVGHNIYSVILQSIDDVASMTYPQIIIAVSSPDGKLEIKSQLKEWEKLPKEDYWFFL